MKVMITGSNGRLGKELKNVFPDAIHTSRNELDFRDAISCATFIQEHEPDVILHIGAKTSIPPCDKDRPGAWSSNVVGTENLVNACLMFKPDVYFVYISTPCIFSGEEEEIDEETLPFPKNFYGLTKLGGELMCRKLEHYCITRANFVAYEKWEHPKAFSDRFSNYLFAHDLALAYKDIVNQKPVGVIHLVGDKKLSMHDLAHLCPDSDHVKEYTLEEYYQDNPNKGKLTKNMMLVSKRWRTYEITTKD